MTEIAYFNKHKYLSILLEKHTKEQLIQIFLSWTFTSYLIKIIAFIFYTHFVLHVLHVSTSLDLFEHSEHQITTNALY